MNRRKFLNQTATATTAVAFYGAIRTVRAADSPNSTIRVGVMGLGRGLDHVAAVSGIQNAEVAMLCDIHDKRIEGGLKRLEGKQARAPKTSKDIRRVLELKDLDALFIAAPNHWHAPASILACSANKHVYVEKPLSHNPREGELLIQAAQKNIQDNLEARPEYQQLKSNYDDAAKAAAPQAKQINDQRAKVDDQLAAVVQAQQQVFVDGRHVGDADAGH